MKILNSIGLVTGGASGFGREFCKSLLSQGGKVLFASMRFSMLEIFEIV